jgi:hypothetical protein
VGPGGGFEIRHRSGFGLEDDPPGRVVAVALVAREGSEGGRDGPPVVRAVGETPTGGGAPGTRVVWERETTRCGPRG